MKILFIGKLQAPNEFQIHHLIGLMKVFHAKTHKNPKQKSIRKCNLWQSVKEVWDGFAGYIQYVVGDSESEVLTRHMVWKLNIVGVVFGMLMFIPTWETSDARGTQSWNIKFTCACNDWNWNQQNLCLRFYNPISQMGFDCLRWRTSNSKFNVQSCYDALSGSIRVSFPCRSIWCTMAPNRVGLFV